MCPIRRTSFDCSLARVVIDDGPCNPLRLSHKKTSPINSFFPGRNRPRKKTHEIARYSAGTIRAIYSKNFCNRRKGPSLGGGGGGVRGSQEGARCDQEVGRARGPPGPPGAHLRLHLG